MWQNFKDLWNESLPFRLVFSAFFIGLLLLWVS